MVRPLVIYIAGYGRSGSTVLDVALGATCDQAVSLGEAIGLPRSSERRRLGCSCGSDYSVCEVWSSCLERSKVERRDWQGVGRRDSVIPIKASSRASYSVFWGRLLDERVRVDAQVDGYRGVAPKSIVIDSSKTTVFSARRPENLLKFDIADVFVIHVKRSLKGILRSRRKGRNVELASGRWSAKLSRIERVLALIWFVIVPLHIFVSNYFAARMKKINGCAGYKKIDFADIIQNPEKVAIEIWKQVAAATGRDVIIRSPVSSRVKPHHIVEGNRLLKDARGVRIRPDGLTSTGQVG